MQHPAEPTISQTELLAQLRVARLRVTARQLKRWRAVGLLPRPQVVGLGRGRGVEPRYPWWVVFQAIAAAVCLSTNRSVDEGRWALWCFGFDLTELIREDLLSHVRQRRDEIARRYRDHRERDPDAIGHSQIEALTEGRRTHPEYRDFTRRFGKRGATSLAVYEHALALGDPFGEVRQLGEDDAPRFLRALHLDEFVRRLTTTPKQRKAAERDIPLILSTMAAKAGGSGLEAALQRAEASWLVQCRNEAETIARHFGLLPHSWEAYLSRGLFIEWFSIRSLDRDVNDFMVALVEPQVPRPQPPLFMQLLNRTINDARRDRTERRKQ